MSTASKDQDSSTKLNCGTPWLKNEVSKQLLIIERINTQAICKHLDYSQTVSGSKINFALNSEWQSFAT